MGGVTNESLVFHCAEESTIKGGLLGLSLSIIDLNRPADLTKVCI